MEVPYEFMSRVAAMRDIDLYPVCVECDRKNGRTASATVAPTSRPHFVTCTFQPPTFRRTLHFAPLPHPHTKLDGVPGPSQLCRPRLYQRRLLRFPPFQHRQDKHCQPTRPPWRKLRYSLGTWSLKFATLSEKRARHLLKLLRRIVRLPVTSPAFDKWSSVRPRPL